MRKTIALAVFVATLAGAHAASAEPFSWDQLAFMTGHWAFEKEDWRSEEFWTDARGGMMAGVNRSARGERAGFEYLRIIDDAGVIYYVAAPGGANPTHFQLIEWGGSRAVFENKAHDFPQRIIYWKEGERLRARIEGVVDGKSRSSEWHWFPAVSDARPAGAKEGDATD